MWRTGPLVVLGLVLLTSGMEWQVRASGGEEQAWRHEPRVERLWNRKDIETHLGRIVRVEKAVAPDGKSHGVHLLVEAEAGTILVCLGPSWYIDDLDIELAVGGPVRVTGSRTERAGRPALVACRITCSDKTVELRDEEGQPLWSGWRREPTEASCRNCVIQGVVRDSSGASVPGAIVFLEPSHQSVETEMSGFFCFSEVEGPELEAIVVTAAGFEEQRVGPLPTVSSAPIQINFVLAPAVVAEIVTVSAATRTLKQLEDVPVRTEVILPELMEAVAARTLADAVEFTPGLRVENNCQNCNFSQIRMLGLQGSYTQVLFDGQPSMSSLAQVYGVEHIPSSMVDQIEVVKGGGSAVYGPGSVGGVINIVPHTPTETHVSLMDRLEWMAGLPDHSLSTSADWTSADHGSAVTVFGQLDSIKPLDWDGDGFTEVAKREFGALGARYRQALFRQQAELVLDFNHVREDRRGGDRLDLPPSQASVAEAVSSRRYATGVAWHHTPGAGLDYRLSFSLAHTNRDSYYGSGMDSNAYGYSSNPLWILDTQFNHLRLSHVISWGGQIKADGIRDVQPAYSREYDETYRNVGFFVQDDWSVLPGWEFIYGVRLDKHSEIANAIVSPRLALMWTARRNLKIRASVAKGFLPPQVFDEDLHISQVGGTGQIIRNAEDLTEERSRSYALGMEWKPTWGSGVGMLEFNLFNTGIDRLFNVVEDDDPATEPVEFSRINFGKARVFGAEFNAGYALGTGLQVQIGYVEQRSRFHDSEPDFGSREFFRTPNRYGLATVTYRNPRFMSVFFGARFTGNMRVPHYAGFIAEDRLETSPRYWVLDASLSRSFSFHSDSEVVVKLGARNLTGFYQSDLDQGPDRDSGYVWGPRFPRSIYVSTSLTF